jgi:outer membrane lipoprotein-sorting protein
MHSGDMTSVLRSRRLRWAVPGLVTAALAATAIISTTTAGASDQPKLPAKTAAQLLGAVGRVHVRGLSGTVVETANLGFPSLPGGDVGGAFAPQALLAGSHRMRVWYGGPGQQRIAWLAPMAELDLIHNGRDLWTYTSTTKHVTHARIGGMSGMRSHGVPAPHGVPDLTPQQVATQVLRAIDPSTRVTVDRTARVAGRAAYQLDINPRDSRSLIGSIRIAIDAVTSLPLRVEVFAAGAPSPALRVGFTDIHFGAQNPSVFRFVPPAGATVTQQRGTVSHLMDQSSHHAWHKSGSRANHPTVLGSGWTAVVKVAVNPHLIAANRGLMNSVSTAVPAGRLITTPLVSILLGKNGYLYAGPVSGAALQRVAATGHGL